MIQPDKPRWIKFDKGNLAGINLFMTEEYAKIYTAGDTDPEMMSDVINENPKGKTIFDVGGFIGSSSLIFARMVGEKGKVISFEPNPFNYDRMKKNFSKNTNLSKVIEIYTCALSSSNGVTDMFLSNNVDGGPSSTSRINQSHSTIRNENLPNSFTHKKVATKKLDDFVWETGIVPDILKVDIEGAEHMLLEGATNTLKKYKPTLYIEIHSEYCAIRCYEILRDMNYALVVINEEDDNRIMIKAKFNKSVKTNKEDYQQQIQYNFQQTSDRLSSQLNKLEVLQKGISGAVENVNNLTEQLALSNEVKNLENNVNILKKEINNIYESKSWQITKPLRLIMGFTKSISSKNRKK